MKDVSRILKVKQRFVKEKQIWFLAIPIILWVLVFAYYPMYGLTMSFVHYIPGKEIFQSDWAGLFFILNSSLMLLIFFGRL